MGSTFSRLKNWIANEVLKHDDLNAEFNNILTNLTPAGVDDESASLTAMRTTGDPYPGGVPSLSASLQEEIQRLRYLVAQITGQTYWYEDPVIPLSDIVTTPTASKVPKGYASGVIDGRWLPIFDPAVYRPIGHYSTMLGMRGLETWGMTLLPNQLRAIPFPVPYSMTFDKIAVHVQTLFAESHIRLGIYTDTGFYPYTLVAGSDVAEIDSSSIGFKELTFSSPIVLSPGIYWLAALCSSSTVKVYDIPNPLELLGIPGTSSFAVALSNHWSHAQTYGALPSTFPDTARVMEDVEPPLIGLKRSA